MSEPILPLRQWPPGIQQASVPANENALRLEALSRPVLGTSNDESTPSDGDVWIVGDTPAGNFSAFDQNDIALYHVSETGVGGWHAWAPVEGLIVSEADGTRLVFSGGTSSEWQEVGGGSGSGVVETIVGGSGISVDSTDPANPVVSATGSGSDDLTIITEASAFTADPSTHSGRSRLILAGGDVTFNSAEIYTSGNVFNIRATAPLELAVSGVTLTPPAGGTLELDADMAVSVAMTSETTGIVIGQTVSAP